MARERKVGRPTHWTRAIDPDTGFPHAVRGDDYAPEEIGGELPPEFGDGRFYDWQPRHDPNGAWIELEDDRRAAVWAQAKAERETQRHESVTVAIAGRSLAFQADQASIDELQLQLAAALADPGNFEPIEWTTAGNAAVTLDAAGLAHVVKAIAAHRREVHARSQDRRARIFDEAAPLVRSLEDVKTKGSKGR